MFKNKPSSDFNGFSSIGSQGADKMARRRFELSIFFKSIQYGH